MRKALFAVAIATTALAAPAFAQDATMPADPAQASPADTAAPVETPAPVENAAPTETAAPVDASTEPTAPDGSKAFGIEPYFGVMGGWERFDTQPEAPGPNVGKPLQGGLVQGVVGVNVPLGPVFVGAEGNVIKGVDGAIDWEYGAAGRFGFRAGDTGMIYGKVGYQWVNFSRFGKDSPDYGAVTYGGGVEVGPKEIGLGGITGNGGFRIRAEASTFGNARSIRPMLGVITHF